MTSEQINAKIAELKQALETHKAFLESLPFEVVDYLNDSCYYVNGAIDTLEMEIFDIESIQCPDDDFYE